MTGEEFITLKANRNRNECPAFTADLDVAAP